MTRTDGRRVWPRESGTEQREWRPAAARRLPEAARHGNSAPPGQGIETADPEPAGSLLARADAVLRAECPMSPRAVRIALELREADALLQRDESAALERLHAGERDANPLRDTLGALRSMILDARRDGNDATVLAALHRRVETAAARWPGEEANVAAILGDVNTVLGLGDDGWLG